MVGAFFDWLRASSLGRTTLLTALLVLLLVDLPGQALQARWFHHLSTVAHAALFAAIAWFVLHDERMDQHGVGKKIAIVLALTLIVGSIIEGLQTLTGRWASLGDLGADLAGAGAVAIMVAPRTDHNWPRLRLPAQLLAICLVTLVLLQPGIFVWTELSLRSAFPTLSDLEGRFEERRWSGGSVDSKVVRQGRHALRFDLTTDQYSGPALTHLARDWRGYRAFRVSIFNDSNTPLPLTLSILDREHRRRGSPYNDRYNSEHLLHSGWNDMEIDIHAIANAPRGRTMDLGDIEQIYFVASKLATPRTIYLDAMVLVQ